MQLMAVAQLSLCTSGNEAFQRNYACRPADLGLHLAMLGHVHHVILAKASGGN